MTEPLRLIAEFCQNHNGDFETLRRMIAAAAEGGATHGKIQTIFARDLAFRPEFEEGASDANGQALVTKRPYQPEYDRLKKLELTYEQQRAFVEECQRAGLLPLTTAFTLTSIPSIQDLGWRSVKVASYDCASYPLLEALVASFDELLVSTGASYDEEVEQAAKLLQASGKPFALMHCVTRYPTPLSEMNLRRLEWLRRLAPSVGLSDHSLVSVDGIKAVNAAIHLGARVIERHFTVLPENETRDGRVSINKEHLREIVRFSRLSPDEQRAYLQEFVPEYDIMLGSAHRALSHEELLNRAYYRGRFANNVGGEQIYNWDERARHLHNGSPLGAASSDGARARN